MVRYSNGEEFYLFSFLKQNNCVLFFYPKIGKNSEYLPNSVKERKGLTGCTMQAKGYISLNDEFKKLGFKVVAVGTQSPKDQEKFKQELGSDDIIFINDEDFLLEQDFRLSSFSTVNAVKFYHRQTLIIKNGEVIHHHEVTEPESDAKTTLEILKKLV